MTSWNDLTARTLEEIENVADHYRPTNFWGPGLRELLDDMEQHGLDSFKHWPTATKWFYPIYGNSWSQTGLEQLYAEAVKIHPGAWKLYLEPALNGSFEARRDYDVAVSFWDQQRWPFDLDSHGESRIGKPRQGYPLVPGRPEVTFGRGYVNYLLCLAALSRHVDAPPASFLEIGGGFGVLGEILLARDPSIRYVDLDIPPLVTVSSYNLTEQFGSDRVGIYAGAHAEPGPIELGRSGVLPSYRIEDLADQFEVFVNSYSFQEMEPDVVDGYVEQVASKGIRYAVSLNSRDGKPRAEKAGDWGALDPVRSDDIVAMFEKRGFRLLAAHDAPLVRGAGRLVVLGRD